MNVNCKPNVERKQQKPKSNKVFRPKRAKSPLEICKAKANEKRNEGGRRMMYKKPVLSACAASPPPEDGVMG